MIFDYSKPEVTTTEIENNKAEAMKIIAEGVKKEYAKKLGGIYSITDTENTISLKSLSTGNGGILSGLGFALGVVAGIAYALGKGFVPAVACLIVMAFLAVAFYRSNAAKMLGLYVAGALSTAIVLMTLSVGLIQFDVDIFGRAAQKLGAYGNTLMFGDIDTPLFVFTSTFLSACINAVIALFLSVICFTFFQINGNRDPFTKGNIAGETSVAGLVFLLTFLGVNIGPVVSMSLMLVAVIFLAGMVKRSLATEL